MKIRKWLQGETHKMKRKNRKKNEKKIYVNGLKAKPVKRKRRKDNG